MTGQINNPAGRLLVLLTEAAQKQDNLSARAVWADVFDLSEDDTREIVKMLATLMDLLTTAEREIEKLENIDKELYAQPFQNIEKAFRKLNLEAPWKTWKSFFDSATLLALRFCSDQLERSSNWINIDKERLEDVLSEINDLTTRVINSNIPENLKRQIVGNLEDIRTAILAYQIGGSEGIEREVERGLGALMLHREEISECSEKAGADEVSDYVQLLERLHMLARAVNSTKELSAPFIQALGIS